MQITVGQIFKDKDKRMNGRHIKIVRVDVLNAWAVTCRPDGSGESDTVRRYAHHTLRAKFELVASSEALDRKSQLYRVIAFAKEHGYLDAANWISDNMPGNAPQGTGIAWIRQYREEKKCSLQEAVDAYNAQR